MQPAEAVLNGGLIKSVDVRSTKVKYLAAGRSDWRFQTLFSKEPETIEWIDGFSPTDTLWDIGANVGIYSIYAAMRGVRVLAFEPNFLNYFHLCTNIKLNGLQDRIMPLCLAFCGGKCVSTINLYSMEFGEAMSTFGSDLDFRGRRYRPVFRQGMIGYSIDAFVADFHLDVPNHFKIDVDGIELDIVRGGIKTFRTAAVRSVQIELVDSNKAQTGSVSEIFDAAGMRYIHKRHNAAAAGESFKDVFNYLYRRS